MMLYFKDKGGKLRVVDTGDVDVDLDQQRPLRAWIEQSTNIRVNSPVLSLYVSEPEIEPIFA